MKVRLSKGVREGIGTILKDGVPFIQIEYHSGTANGPVCRMDDFGVVDMKGELMNGLEYGLFVEYDRSKEVVWRGYYRNGARYSEVVESSELDGYYDEKRESTGLLLSTAQYDESLQEKYGNDSYSDASVTELKLSGLDRLKRLVIGDDCFKYVRVFELDGLSELESVVIGKDSFTQTKDADPSWNAIPTQGSFQVVNCSKLKSIQIGFHSFGDYHSFELTNLPSLQSIDIGYHCFYWTPLFSLTGLID